MKCFECASIFGIIFNLLKVKIKSGVKWMLASYAVDPAKTKGRLHKELSTSYRNEFERDRDRIIHSNAFRRLQYKTQVFINHEGDHYRNRLTHSIEVSTVARSIANTLGLSSDLAEAVTTAVINKRAGGQGLISGRKAFQKPVQEGVALLNAIQDVYLDKTITIA